MTLKDLRAELQRLADAETALHAQRFFKTGPGQYGEGDLFLGVRVPEIRRLAKLGRALPLDQVARLLHSRWHEERLLALIILAGQYKSGGEDLRQRYLKGEV